MSEIIKKCPKCKQMSCLSDVMWDSCTKCGYRYVVPAFPSKNPEFLDMSHFAPPISWAQRTGHVEFNYPEIPEDKRY